jgi:hypothetical protein
VGPRALPDVSACNCRGSNPDTSVDQSVAVAYRLKLPRLAVPYHCTVEVDFTCRTPVECGVTSSLVGKTTSSESTHRREDAGLSATSALVLRSET